MPQTVKRDWRYFSLRDQSGKLPLPQIVDLQWIHESLTSFNTPRGALNVSTPEATALDLVGCSDRVGGLDEVAMVIAELAERIDREKLADAAAAAPLPWAQRLGYVLGRVGATDKTAPLNAFVLAHET